MPIKKWSCLCVLACVMLACSSAQGQQQKPPGIRVVVLDETPRELALRSRALELLEQSTFDLSLEEVSLSQAIEALKKASGLDIQVDWLALELVGIDKDSIVKYQASGRTAAEHLGPLLTFIGADLIDEDKPEYTVRHGEVLISTLREIRTNNVSRTYNIGALVREPYRPVGMQFSETPFEDTVAFHAWLRGERLYPMTDAAILDVYKQHLEKMKKEVENLDPGDDVKPRPEAQNGGLFFADDNPQRADPNEYVQPAIEQIIELIHNTVDHPDIWLDEVSTIDVQGDLLVIKTRPESHDQIEILLNTLLVAEINRQSDLLKDAHVTRQLALANARLEAGDLAGAKAHVRRALWIMPDHIPALAMRQLLEALENEPDPAS